MITDRPCCDNCLHAKEEKAGFETVWCFFDGQATSQRTSRCHHHPFIASMDTLIRLGPNNGFVKVGLVDCFKDYIAEVTQIRAFLDGKPSDKPVLPSEWWKFDACEVRFYSSERAVLGTMGFEEFKVWSRRAFRCDTIDRIVRGGCVDPWVVFRGRGQDGLFHDKPLLEQPLSWFGPAPVEKKEDETWDRR